MIRAFLSFDNFLFPRMVRMIYFIGLVLIVLSTMASLLSVGFVTGGFVDDSATSQGIASLFMIGGALITTIISCIVWRLFVELCMVAFSINDNLRAIRESGLQK